MADAGRRAGTFPWLLVAPAVLVILLIGLFPLIYTLMASFQNVSLLDEDTSFQGMLNYQRLLEDARFWESLLHTAILLVLALPLELLLGLALALLFLDRMPGKQILTTLLVLPVVISPVVAGAMWRLLLDNRFGPINHILSWLWGQEVTILWTIQPLAVYPAILMAEVWQWTPFMFLLLGAALAGVDPAQQEAARLDGASYFRTLWSITLPAIRPVLAIAVLIRALDLFRLFDVVWALTQGGPGTMTETISIYTYLQGFRQFETSYTAAMAVVVILLLTLIVMQALRRVEIAR